MTRKFFVRSVTVILLVWGIYISGMGYLDKAIQIFGMDLVKDSNQEYLNDSFDKAVTGFLILSGIKSGLAVIEGSEIGVGFNLELGDLVQSVYDYVDVAWKTALAGGTIVLLTRLMLQAAEMIDHWFLALLLFFLLMSLVFKWFFPRFLKASRFFKEAYFFLIIFTVVLYLVLPFSISCSAFLSEKITQPLIQESHDSFESIKEDFSYDQISKRLFTGEKTEDESWLTRFNILDKFNRAGEKINEQAQYFREKTKNIAIWTIQLIAGYLFDSIIFPLTFFFLIFVITKSILLFLFEKRKSQSLMDDVNILIQKYYGTGGTKPVRPKPRRRPIKKIRRYSINS